MLTKSQIPNNKYQTIFKFQYPINKTVIIEDKHHSRDMCAEKEQEREKNNPRGNFFSRKFDDTVIQRRRRGRLLTQFMNDEYTLTFLPVTERSMTCEYTIAASNILHYVCSHWRVVIGKPSIVLTKEGYSLSFLIFQYCVLHPACR